MTDDTFDIERLREALEKEGILSLTFGGRMRMVTHLDVSTDDIEYFASALSLIL
jgi:hypothetical protein